MEWNCIKWIRTGIFLPDSIAGWSSRGCYRNNFNVAGQIGGSHGKLSDLRKGRPYFVFPGRQISLSKLQKQKF